MRRKGKWSERKKGAGKDGRSGGITLIECAGMQREGMERMGRRHPMVKGREERAERSPNRKRAEWRWRTAWKKRRKGAKAGWQRKA
jgi:hypothetical protein